MRPAHRILGLMRPAVIVPAGRAWRLGVLLIDRSGQLYATGMVTRAVTPKRGVADHSLIADARREDQRAAVRGSFAEGEVVNFGYSPIPLDEDSLLAGTGLLSVNGTTVTVRWDTSGAGRAAHRSRTISPSGSACSRTTETTAHRSQKGPLRLS